MTYLFDEAVFDFEIGDLVRLIEDHKIEIGYGLVTDIKDNLDDVYDLEYLRERFRSFREIIDLREQEIFPSKPQILVLWSGKAITSENTSIWMYASELTIVQKVMKETK
jgi:hypothetical protein